MSLEWSIATSYEQRSTNVVAPSLLCSGLEEQPVKLAATDVSIWTCFIPNVLHPGKLILQPTYAPYKNIFKIAF